MRKSFLILFLLAATLCSAQQTISPAQIFQFNQLSANPANPPNNSAYVAVVNGSLICILPSGASCANSSSSTPTGPAAGDLGGTYPNPTVISVADVNTGVLYLGGLNCNSCAAFSLPYINTGVTALNYLAPSNPNGFLQNSGSGPVWDGNLTDSAGNLTYNGTITATKFIGTGPYYLQTVFPSGALTLPGASQSALAVDQNGAWNVSENNGAFATIPTFVTNAQTGTYQALTSDFAQCKTIPVASGTFTITLVASGSQPLSGQCINVVNYGSGVVTIARSGQNINGAASNFTINAGSASAPTSATITSDGTNYVATIDEGTVGTVVSVAQTVPSGFAIGGSPITGTGTLAITYSVSGAGQVIDSSGSNAAGFTAAPTLGVASTTNGTLTLSSSGSATQVVIGENSSAQFTFNNALAMTGTTNATNTILSTNTNQPILISPNGTGAVIFNAGAAATPSINFAGDATTVGLYAPSTSAVCWVTASTCQVELLGAGVKIGNGNEYAFASTAAGTGSQDTGIGRLAAGYISIDAATGGGKAGFQKGAQHLRVKTADVTCGTGGTLTPCTSLTTITGLSVALPSVAEDWSFNCDIYYSQATGTSANQLGVQTATNGATNLTAGAEANTAAAVVTQAVITDVASTTTSQSVITFTPSATGFKGHVHLAGTIEGASASGTTLNVQILTGSGADLLTIYRGSECWVY